MKNLLLVFCTFVAMTVSGQTAAEYYAEAKILADNNIEDYQIPQKINEALKLDSTNVKFYSLLGAHYLKKRQHNRAIANYKKAVALNPDNLDYYWSLSAALLKQNIRGSDRTDAGVFEGLAVIDTLLKKGAASVKIYERIIMTNQVILADYHLRYQNYRAPKTDSWQDDTPDLSEKKRFKKVALEAYDQIVKSAHEILTIAPKNQYAASILKYLKKPVFN